MSFRKFIIRLSRIKVDYQLPPEIHKCVLIMAPHTSLYDFILGKIILKELGVTAVIVVKKEFFFFPLGLILKKLGCVPVDRQHATRFPKFAAELIKSHNEMTLLICPEGTRKRTKSWKRGFYLIAREAQVPICFGFLDYRSRRGGIWRTCFHPSGDYQQDLAQIESFYNGMLGFHQNHFNLEDKPYAHPDWIE